MAKKVTQEDIINFNELYLKHKTYAGVARETGFAPTTVKKYIVQNYISMERLEKKEFTEDMIPEEIDFSLFKGKDDWGDLCLLTEEEKEELKKLWKEMAV